MAKAKKADNPEIEDGSPSEETQATGHYQEWEVKVVHRKIPNTDQVENEAEKIKMIRPVVKITDTEAETLNNGVLQGLNTYTKMYFKA